MSLIVMQGLIYVIDGNSDRVIDTISVGGLPVQVAIDQKTGILYVSNWAYPEFRISVINATTDMVVANITNVQGRSYGIAVNPDNDLVYANIQGYAGRAEPNIVSVINGSSYKVIANITTVLGIHHGVSTIPGANRELNIAVNPVTNLIYATNHWEQFISVINGSSNKIIANITQRYYSHLLAVDEKHNLVYSTNSNNQELAVINGSTNQIMKAIDTGIGANSMAVNLGTGMLYIAGGMGFYSYIYVRDTATIPEFGSSLAALLMTSAAFLGIIIFKTLSEFTSKKSQ